MAEDERFGLFTSIEVVDAWDLEKFVGNLDNVPVVSLQVLGADETIGVYTLRLVQPQLGQLRNVVEVVRGGEEETLEHVREVADGELVVEVDGSLAEALHNLLVVRQRSLDQFHAKLLAIRVEMLQVAVEERAVDLHQRILAREVYC